MGSIKDSLVVPIRRIFSMLVCRGQTSKSKCSECVLSFLMVGTSAGKRSFHTQTAPECQRRQDAAAGCRCLSFSLGANWQLSCRSLMGSSNKTNIVYPPVHYYGTHQRFHFKGTCSKPGPSVRLHVGRESNIFLVFFLDGACLFFRANQQGMLSQSGASSGPFREHLRCRIAGGRCEAWHLIV